VQQPLFTWDPNKAESNRLKHGVTFEEASTVFRDPSARIYDDPSHSNGEAREFIIGHSAFMRLLLVSFVEHPNSIRLISARQADASERKRHEEETWW